MKNADEVAVFWDYENCPVPTNASGYAIVDNIRSLAQTFGSVKLFKAYLEVTEQVPVSRALLLRSELQSSGVSLTDCPHNGRKDVADKMILVDMLAHAIDNPAPSTIVLISGDRDFAYALSILRLRRYRVILITLSNAHPSLRAQASLCFDWVSDVLELLDSTSVHQPTSPYRGKPPLPTTHDKFYPDPRCHNPSRFPFQDSHDEKSASNVGFTNYFRDAIKRRESPRTPSKHDAGRDFFPLDFEQYDIRQPGASSVTDDLCNGPEYPAKVITPPVVSSTFDGSLEAPLPVTADDSNSSKPTVSPSTSAGSTPKLATYSILPSSSTHNTLRGCASLPNLYFAQVASVMEPVSFKSAMQIPPVATDLQGPLLPPQQQDEYPLINAQTHNLSSVNQINNKGDSASPPKKSDTSPPPNVAVPPSASAPSFLLPSTLSQAVVSAITQSSVKAANPVQPTSFPAVPYKFKVLIQCLKSHRSKGRLRPLRSPIALEIHHNGITYRQAGVLKFRQYVALAEKAGIIELGGSGLTAWIALKAPWYDVPLS